MAIPQTDKNRLSVDNILRVYGQATTQEHEDGMDWYLKAHIIAAHFAQENDVPLTLSAAVISALSPNNSWPQNLRDAEQLIKAFKAGFGIHTVRPSTYRTNTRKAWRILQHPTFLDDLLEREFFTALKTRNFMLNIIEPTDPDPVTIDTHALSIACGLKYPWDSTPSMNKSEYQMVADLYREAASHTGLVPNQLQAITWVTWKRMGLTQQTTLNI